MAKLGSYYGLCPLIDQHSLLGISEDAESGHVVVTLGRNIAIKYKLSNQKQVHSWRTKDKFSSAVVYNKDEQKYMAVFNQTHLRMWDGNEESLDKLKKYKFNKPMHTIINNEDMCLVFQNGGIVPLKTALAKRKELIVDDVINVNTEEIMDVSHVTVDSQSLTYIGLLVKSQNEKFFTWTIFINGTSSQQFEKINLNRGDATLAGYVLCQTQDKHVNLFTLWSDGKLFIRSLSSRQNQESDNPHGFYFANIESVSCKQFVTMTTISSDYIAIYGADCNQEGANLIIYNLQFKVSQSKQSFKMYSNVAKIWRIETNLLICVGQNLAVVPYYLSTEQLAALVGSHVVMPSERDPDVTIVEDLKIVNWDVDGAGGDEYTELIPLRIKPAVLELLEQGLSEAMICEHLLPIFIDNDDLESIETCLGYFKDVPEKCVVSLIKFCIVKINNSQQTELVDIILALPFSEVLILPHIRRKLDVDDSLLLLKYICNLLSKDDHMLPNLDVVGTEKRLIEWSCLLLDASYQKFLLTHDERIQDLLHNFRNTVQSHLGYLEDLKDVIPLLNEIKRVKKKQIKTSQKYSIEQLNLY